MRIGRFAAPLLVVILVMVGSGCARRGLILKERSDSEARAIVIGDVRAVEQGDATERRMWSVPSATFAAALGNSAVVHDANRQGTSMVLDGVAYVHSFAPEQRGAVEIADKEQFSSFLVGVPPQTQPTARYRVNGGSDGMTLANIYKELASRHGEILLVVGTGQLSFSEELALKRAANEGEAPIENLEKYYEPNRHRFNPEGVFVGVVLADVRDLRGSNMRVFSPEPGRRLETEQVSRTHFARLGSMEGVTPDSLDATRGRVQDVTRLLSMSRVKSADLAVYAVRDFEKR